MIIRIDKKDFERAKTMKNLERIGLCMLIAGCLLSINGCGKEGPDVVTPISQLQAEADKMSVKQLKSRAMEYKNMIVAMKGKLEKLAAKLKEIPITEQSDAKAKEIQNSIGYTTEYVAKLTERFQVYYKKLKEKSGDVSGLDL